MAEVGKILDKYECRLDAVFTVSSDGIKTFIGVNIKKEG